MTPPNLLGADEKNEKRGVNEPPHTQNTKKKKQKKTQKTKTTPQISWPGGEGRVGLGSLSPS